MRNLGIIFLFVIGMSYTVSAEVVVQPQSAQDIESVFNYLEEGEQGFCVSSCIAWRTQSFDGDLDTGSINFRLEGTVVGEKPALVAWAKIDAMARFENVRMNGASSKIVWDNGRVMFKPSPGEVVIEGKILSPPNMPLGLELLGAVGRLDTDVKNAQLLGLSQRRGLQSPRFQWVPKHVVAHENVDVDATRYDARLHLRIGREKEFSFKYVASGAGGKSILTIPLPEGLKVEHWDKQVLTLKPESNSFEWAVRDEQLTTVISGKWESMSMELQAPPLPHEAEFSVTCDDPMVCTFGGNAKLAPGSTATWLPLAEQKLLVNLRRLKSQVSPDTAAQSFEVKSQARRGSVEQELYASFESTSGRVVHFSLPAGAKPSRLTLDGTTMPLLKDKLGRLAVSLPTGTSEVEIKWELSTSSWLFWSFNSPSVDVPIAVRKVGFSPQDGYQTIWVGGGAGAPKIPFWQQLFLVILVGLGTWMLLGRQKVNRGGAFAFFAMAFGFSLRGPGAFMGVAGFALLWRFIVHYRRDRSRLRAVLELVCLGSFALLVTTQFLDVLHEGLFYSNAFNAENMVGGRSPYVLGETLAGFSDSGLRISAFLIPIFWLHLLWALWSVLAVRWFWKEGHRISPFISPYLKSVVVKIKSKA